MDIAHAVAKRGTCDRAHVGCVIMVDGDIVAQGYNGAPRRAPHCDDAGHDMLNGSCVRTVHAEINALCRAARSGVSVSGGTAYVTHEPCRVCAYALLNAGIDRVVYEIEREPATRQAIEDRPRVIETFEMTSTKLQKMNRSQQIEMHLTNAQVKPR